MPVAINPSTGEAVFLAPDGQWKPAQTAVNPQTNEKLVYDGQQWQPLQDSAPADKYVTAARQEFNQAKAAGVPVEAGYARRLMQGATFGGGDEILAGLSTPLEMISHGTFNPIEGYKYAKAYEDTVMDDARKREGGLGTAAEIVGSLGSAGGLGKAGLTLGKEGVGLVSRALRLAGEGAGYGGVQGFLDGGNSLADRAKGAAEGASMGAAVGGALPIVASTAKTLAAPIVSNIRARINPTGVATSQVARAVEETGKSIPDVVSDVQTAAAEGQPMYTVADALGFPGQRLLRTGISASGPGRAQAVDFLEQRQAGQGRRVANALAEGFQAPQTARQTADRLTQARDAAADKEYTAVRTSAVPVDLSDTIGKIDETLRPGVNQVANPGSGIANDSVEASLARMRSLLTDGKSMVTDFPTIQRARGDLSDEIEKAVRQGANNKARLLLGVKDRLDAAMEKASPDFRQANRNYAQRSAAIDAIDTGKTAAMRGRVEDTVPAFHSMPADQQAAFRVGYVDPLLEQVQSAAAGANKARPFTSDAFQTEAHTVAPLFTGNRMMNRLAREQRMFETRAEATGGSKTDMNLADQEAQKVDPGLLMDVGTFNVPSLMRRGLATASNALHGYTPAVREQIVKLLLQRGASPQIETQIAAELDALNRRRAVAAALLRGTTIGTSTLLPQYTTR